MILDLFFNNRSPGSEVRKAPEIVPIHLQPESVEVGEARERNNTAYAGQVWNAAENCTEAPPPRVPQIFLLIWSRAVSSLAVHAEEHNQDGKKWLDTVPHSNPASRNIVIIVDVLQC